MTAAARVRSLTCSFIRHGDMSTLLEEVLSAAIEVTHADFGNIQLLNPETETLRIVAHSGFTPKFLEYFDEVHIGEAACGTAMKTRQQILVEDVTNSPVFRDAKTIEVILEAGIRGVQSTPLTSRSGEFVGMISTHYRVPWLPSERELRMLDTIARLAADFIEWKMQNPMHEARAAFPSPATVS
jgi:GAF domain-containing protein